MSYKEEFIAKYGEEAWAKKCERSRLLHKQKYDNDPAFREKRKAKANKRFKTHKEHDRARVLKLYKERIATDPIFKEHRKEIAEKNKQLHRSILQRRNKCGQQFHILQKYHILLRLQNRMFYFLAIYILFCHFFSIQA